MNGRVSAWLDSLGLGIYGESFEHNAITWDVLHELNEGDLEALGVLLGHRKKILRAIAQLSQSAEVVSPESKRQWRPSGRASITSRTRSSRTSPVDSDVL
ncbi:MULTISPECIES: SAM domain-containing protein [Nitrosomonas]|uniref:SAM (Sterile alpha motif) domain-containing protein n=1 Tax=Nitrosomonas communis TaxID=44574 RepID=A0A5D3YA60_9PROT|nr:MULTISPECIES: SAM domain-containing protein [Nitrosomonas]TYP75789.1 SAM (Sterile alpha motif) domain-containing protein [Nitrosomonas communis]UVS60587.1 SAM domain-containing protein [Nitrosomonas sp. PLL12]